MFIWTQDRNYIINTNQILDFYTKHGELHATGVTSGEKCDYTLGEVQDEKQAMQDFALMLRNNGELVHYMGEHDKNILE